MTELKAKIDALFDAMDDVDELPAPVEAAINDLASAVEAKPNVPWWKAPFFKNGQFSKTATFVTLAYAITLGWYAASMFADQQLDLGFIRFSIKTLDPALATAVLSISTTGYVANNVVKNRAAPHG